MPLQRQLNNLAQDRAHWRRFLRRWQSISELAAASSRRGLARAASMPLQRQRSNGSGAKPPLEWRRFLTVEERTGVRSKLRAAYADQCKTYEELLDTVTAIEEELLHMAAPSRLDYFKAGVQFDRRVADKRKQLAAPAAGEGAAAAAEAPRKRARPATRARRAYVAGLGSHAGQPEEQACVHRIPPSQLP